MKNFRTRALLALMSSAGIPLACSGGGTVNIGNTNAVGSQLSDYAANWDGYAEAYTFTPDGSDRVRLTIAANGQGTLEVGNSALLALPTDPNLGFPPGDEGSAGGYPTNSPPLGEGVLFPIYGAQVQTNRIQVGIKPNDYYAAWCALQTPSEYKWIEFHADGGPPGLPDGGGTLTEELVPIDAGDGTIDAGLPNVYRACQTPLGTSGSGADTICYLGDNGQSTQVDCGKYYLCVSNVCACTATGCTSSPLVATDSAPSQFPVELDAALDSTGKTLTGTLALSTNLRVTVVLTKQ